MSGSHRYFVPDYYSDFRCKGPDCRSTCCHGWGVSISMKDYFRLLGIECSPALRKKLDCAFHLVESPTTERYAQITPNWEGNCPMLQPDGYCQLQCECGEKALPDICRYYPRGLHVDHLPECSCSNSCEAVLELLFKLDEPVRFHEETLSIDLPENPSLTERHYGEIRFHCIHVLQDRRYSLAQRLAHLGDMLAPLNDIFMSGDNAAIECEIARWNHLEYSELPKPDPPFTLHMLLVLATYFEDNSLSLQPHFQALRKTLDLCAGSIPTGLQWPSVTARYQAAAAHFSQIFPDWERLFEQMLVNHVFFERFPFSNNYENLWDEYRSLCAAYAFVRFLAVGWMNERTHLHDLVDVCAAAFRLIDHSNFDWNAVVLLNAQNFRSAGDMVQMIQL